MAHRPRQVDEGQYLEGSNVGRSIFRNLEISNIKITKDELSDFFYFRIFYSFKLFEHSKYII